MSKFCVNCGNPTTGFNKLCNDCKMHEFSEERDLSSPDITTTPINIQINEHGMPPKTSTARWMFEGRKGVSLGFTILILLFVIGAIGFRVFQNISSAIEQSVKAEPVPDVQDASLPAELSDIDNGYIRDVVAANFDGIVNGDADTYLRSFPKVGVDFYKNKADNADKKIRELAESLAIPTSKSGEKLEYRCAIKEATEVDKDTFNSIGKDLSERFGLAILRAIDLKCELVFLEDGTESEPTTFYIQLIKTVKGTWHQSPMMLLED